MSKSPLQSMLKYQQVIKGATPPKGFVPIPGSRSGGWRKREGNKWVYWYPDGSETYIQDIKDAAKATGKAVRDVLASRLGKELKGTSIGANIKQTSSWAEVFGLESDAWADKLIELQTGWAATAGHDLVLGDSTGQTFEKEQFTGLGSGVILRSNDYDAWFRVWRQGDSYTIQKNVPGYPPQWADKVPASTVQALMSRWTAVADPHAPFNLPDDAHGEAWHSELLLFTGPAGVEEVVKSPLFIRTTVEGAVEKAQKLKAVKKLAGQAVAVVTASLAPVVNPTQPTSVTPSDVLVAGAAKDAPKIVVDAADKIAAAQGVSAEAQAILEKLEAYAKPLAELHKGLWQAGREAAGQWDSSSNTKKFANLHHDDQKKVIYKAEMEFLKAAKGRKVVEKLNLTKLNFTKTYDAFTGQMKPDPASNVFVPPPFTPPPAPTPPPPLSLLSSSKEPGMVPSPQLESIITDVTAYIMANGIGKPENAKWYVERLGKAAGLYIDVHPNGGVSTMGNPITADAAVRYLSTPGILPVPYRLPDGLVGQNLDLTSLVLDAEALGKLQGLSAGLHADLARAKNIFKYNRLHHIEDIKAARIVAEASAAGALHEKDQKQWAAVAKELEKAEAKQSVFVGNTATVNPMARAAELLAAAVDATLAPTDPAKATAEMAAKKAAHDAEVAAYNAAVAAHADQVAAAKAAHDAAVVEAKAKFDAANVGKVTADLEWGTPGLDKLRSAVTELRAKSPESIQYKTVVGPDGGRYMETDFGLKDFTLEYKHELVKAARALTQFDRTWANKYCPVDIQNPTGGDAERVAEYQKLAKQAGVSEKAMMEVVAAVAGLTRGHVVGVHYPDIAAGQGNKTRYQRANATLMTLSTYQDVSGEGVNEPPPVAYRYLKLAKDTLAGITAGLTLTLEAPVSFSRHEYTGAVGGPANIALEMRDVIYVVQNPKQGFNVEMLSYFGQEEEHILAGTFGVEEVYTGEAHKHPVLQNFPGRAGKGARTYVILRQLEQDEKAVLGLAKGGAVPMPPEFQCKFSAAETIAMAEDALRLGSGVPITDPDDPEPRNILEGEAELQKGGWTSKRARDASRRLAEFEAMKVGGTVIPLPEPIAPPPIGSRIQTVLKTWKRLGLDKSEADKQVQHLIRSNDFRKAVAVMENMIEAMNPPRGFVPVGAVHGAFVKVRNGEPVQYWKAGKLMTPDVFGRAFLGEFDPGATIQTSAGGGNDLDGAHLTPDDPLGEEVNTEVVAEAERREAQPVTRDTREINVLEGTLLQDMFSVNGGGSYNF